MKVTHNVQIDKEIDENSQEITCLAFSVISLKYCKMQLLACSWESTFIVVGLSY
jgi:hypothetical protein